MLVVTTNMLVKEGRTQYCNHRHCLPNISVSIIDTAWIELTRVVFGINGTVLILDRTGFQLNGELLLTIVAHIA